VAAPLPLGLADRLEEFEGGFPSTDRFMNLDGKVEDNREAKGARISDHTLIAPCTEDRVSSFLGLPRLHGLCLPLSHSISSQSNLFVL